MSQLTGNDPLPAEVQPEVVKNFCRKLAILQAKMRVLPAGFRAGAGHFQKSAIFSFPLVFEFLNFIENCNFESLK